MKKIIKKVLSATGVVALILGVAIGASAFGKKNKIHQVETPVKVKAIDQTWQYNGSSSDSPTDPSKYSLSSGQPCGTLLETVCKLNAPASSSNPNQPDMAASVDVDGDPNPSTVSQRISDALSNISTHPEGNETVTNFGAFN